MVATGILGQVRVANVCPSEPSCWMLQASVNEPIARLARKSGLTDPRRALPGICSEYAMDRTIRLPATCLVLWKLYSRCIGLCRKVAFSM